MTTEAQKEKLEKVVAELEEKNVNPDGLCILFIGTGEQVIGWCEGTPIPGQPVDVLNPKRILRLQQVQGSGISISLMVGDLDLIEGGKVSLVPQLVAKVRDQNQVSQLSIYELYKEFLDRKVANRAVEAGLVIPDKGLSGGNSPFRKR